MKTLLFISFLSASLAQEKPADPITDKMRYEVATAQRDYLLAKERLQGKIEEAEKACGDAGKRFDSIGLECIDKPR